MNQRLSRQLALNAALALSLASAAGAAFAEVGAEEAAKLKTTLTPFGAERAANAAGTIPAWTGAYETPLPGWKPGQRRPDPFAADKPLFSITAANVAQYAEQLSEGSKAMFKKYPQTFRMDVYPTRRTAGAPAWVYENTFRNATSAKLANGSAGPKVVGAYGGIPFPIPKTGTEVMWNTMLRFKGAEAMQAEMQGYLITPDGKPVLSADTIGVTQYPYFTRGEWKANYTGDFLMMRLGTVAPTIRAGEVITGSNGVDPADDKVFVYLPGQRRVRRLPNACCDTPTPAAAGVASFDEIQVYNGQIDRFDWKLIGKREVIIPYNNNRFLVPRANKDVIGANHPNPDHVRWELHRVWVVEATLAAGKRHVVAKSRYYVDEDSWVASLAERYDANGELWKHLWTLSYPMPERPGIETITAGFNDLISGNWFISGVMNEKESQIKPMPLQPSSYFNPATLAGEGAR